VLPAAMPPECADMLHGHGEGRRGAWSLLLLEKR
jgi:hypothetical protein